MRMEGVVIVHFFGTEMVKLPFVYADLYVLKDLL